MCWTCDRPGSTQADHYAHMVELVERFGWAVQFVQPDRVRAPYAYTVGLTLLGAPELVITGMSASRVHPLINDEARRVVDEGAPSAGDQLVLTTGRAAEVVDLPHPDAHLHTAVALFGPETVQAVQLVWADDRGRRPWERGHRAGRGGQSVLGPRATPSRPA